MEFLDLYQTIEEIEGARIFDAGGPVCFVDPVNPSYGKFAITDEALYFFFNDALNEEYSEESRQKYYRPRVIKLKEIAAISKGIGFLKPFTIIETNGLKTKFGTWKKKELFAFIGK